MTYGYILIIIPIILLTAFIVMVTKRMTEGSSLGEAFGMKSAVLGVIVLMVGMLVMIPIIDSVDPHYEYDSDSKTFTVYRNITGTEFSWGNAANAESLIIEDGVTTISAGAFASFDDLKYISIPESLTTIGEGAFDATLKDYLDQTITDPEAGEYVGTGDGTLYYSDGSIFTYSTDGKSITGLTSDAASAVNLVLPSKNGSTSVTALGTSAFENKTTVERTFFLPDSTIESLGASVFKGTGLLSITLPDSITAIPTNLFQNCTNLTAVDGGAIVTISQNAFNGCTSLAGYVFPSTLTSVAYNSFYGCTSLTSLELPEGLTTIGPRAFQGCTGVTTIYIPASITQIDANAFNGCTGVTSVAVASGFSPETFESAWAPSWTFYDSDGTTTIDKTVASNLAGYTFQGTSSALVKVVEGAKSLTTEQTLKVQELTKAAMTLKLEESELQISEKTELAEA